LSLVIFIVIFMSAISVGFDGSIMALPVHFQLPSIIFDISVISAGGFGISIFFGASFAGAFAASGAFASPATATVVKPTVIASAIEIFVKLMFFSPLPSWNARTLVPRCVNVKRSANTPR
jgi:hypothetical protein